MRKVKILFLLLLFVFTSSLAFSGVIGEGKWFQTSSTAGACDNCFIDVTSLTPHILQLKNSLGWIGFLYYDAEKDEYSGFFELYRKVAKSSDDFTNEVFLLTVKNNGGIMTIDAVSTDHMFISTYRKK